MSHPALVFDFGPDGRICMPIEVRFRKGPRYAVLRSLYRLNEDADRLRTAFLDYVAAINALYDNPRWYHAPCADCPTSFYRLPHSQRRCDWRVIANGRLDRALYEAGRRDRSLPFAELRRISYINDLAETAPEEGFGDHLRREIERLRDGR